MLEMSLPAQLFQMCPCYHRIPNIAIKADVPKTFVFPHLTKIPSAKFAHFIGAHFWDRMCTFTVRAGSWGNF